ncbi:MAG: EAL domain-containing protein [Veillonellaceae bacterium]|nr:EAL domain-containing protein [Veillonellaceae bacterium]
MLRRWRERLTSYVPGYGKNSSLLFIFGSVVLCLLWGYLFHAIDTEEGMEIAGATKESANLAQAFEEHLLRTIGSVDKISFAVKAQYEKDGRALELPALIRHWRLYDRAIVLMSVIDENGDLAVSSQQPFVPSHLSDREHFLVHKDSISEGLFISKPVLGRSSGKWSIQFTRRVNKPDGSFGGVVVISVDPFYFTSFYDKVDLGPGSTISLLGYDGVVRARQSDREASLGENVSHSEFWRRIQDEKSGSVIAASSIDGVQRIFSFRTLNEYPLILAVGIDRQGALSAFRERVGLYYRTAGSATLVILLFLGLLLRNMRRQKQAEMALHQAKTSVENEVRLRTQELSDTNRDLAAEISRREQVEADLHQKNAAIYQMAYFDPLTGLPNRARLGEHLTGELDKARRAGIGGALLFIDLDDLKTVNDLFGHSYGDEIIATAGARIVGAVGKATFVARVGGDEFVVLLPGARLPAELDEIGHRLTETLGMEYVALDKRFRLSASIGIAEYPQDGDTGDEILKNADTAMYVAKHAGKNCWRFFDPAIQEAAFQKMLVTGGLRQALQRGELSVHYQPQVLVGQEKIVGFEALLRWRSEEYGTIAPTVFIPLAEQSGLIHSLGEWVIGEACRFAAKLAQNGLDNLHVAVNVSSSQLAADSFAAIVHRQVATAGINPRQLELEITESALLHSVEDATRLLWDLRTMGIRLALDDFGTGYSSLSYLRHLPIETLKIDKSFIDRIGADESTAKIVGAIIEMAHALNMNVVAEGAETPRQVELLTELECDCVQGFVFSRPVPEQELLAKFVYCSDRPEDVTCKIYHAAFENG